MIFTCPVCGRILEKEEKLYRCEEGHSYDRAKEGYVHLLPVQKMHSKVPGDGKDMIAARRTFLAGGFYACFAEKLARLAVEAASGKNRPVILDAGCGEGYYLREVEKAMKGAGIEALYYGFDISKFAVKAAAKQQKDADFAVGSMFAIPCAEASADIVLNVFAPMVEEEIARVLKPGGIFLFAVPGERHLFGLKEILYEDPYENTKKDTEYEGLTFVGRESVSSLLELTDPDQIRNLFAMTPYYWKTPVSGSQALQETGYLRTEIAFDFLIYQRNGA